MTKRLALTASTCALSALLLGCRGGNDRTYKEAGDTPRAAPSGVPTLDAAPDSTTGVARSSGQPGAAGDTISRTSKISAPPGKTPDPKRP
jgi:hypothetical protein